MVATLLAIAAPSAIAQSATADAALQGAVRAAIESAVRQRIDGDAVVQISDLRIVTSRPDAAGALVATPAPGTRTERPARFTLRWPGTAAFGEAACVVRVETVHLRAARQLERGTVLRDGDFERVREGIGSAPLKPLPQELSGGRVLRDVKAGTVLGPPLVALGAMVRSGDEVFTFVRAPGLEVRGRAVAAQSGDLGEVIRVVNRDSGRPLRGRVVARGEVEVIHGR
jgi:flagella basal body P-ring formation protein FlgA